MNVEEFNQLKDLVRIETILQFGQLIAERIEPERKIFFYKVFLFYVELTYNSKDELKAITTFTNVAREQPYDLLFTRVNS